MTKRKDLLLDIRALMIHNPHLGGRTTLDSEKVIYLLTGEYHNSKCPVCEESVSCVCTSKCKHIWYCHKHILNHTHRKTPYMTVQNKGNA